MFLDPCLTKYYSNIGVQIIAIITLFISITMFCETKNIPQNISGYFPYSVPHNIVMDRNNVMMLDLHMCTL